jgi:hypothetical protein
MTLGAYFLCSVYAEEKSSLNVTVFPREGEVIEFSSTMRIWGD